MPILHVLVLLFAGLAGGFVAGIIGVGGGIIFAPVLFFYFRSIEIGPHLVTPLTLGSSLVCTFVAAAASAYTQHAKGFVAWSTAATAGACSAVLVFLMVRYVTTTAWYDGGVFEVVFGILLLIVVIRMMRGQKERAHDAPETAGFRWRRVGGIGAAAGIVSPAAGIGGGIVMVPSYHHLLGMDLKRAFATSSATIMFISLAGIVNYALFGQSVETPPTAIGYVDLGRAALLSLPAILGAHWGVKAAHAFDTKPLRWGFAGIGVLVAAKLLV